MTALRGLPLLQLVADGVRGAQADSGTCAVCGRAIRRGDRIADLADGGGIVHVAGCSAIAAGTAPGNYRRDCRDSRCSSTSSPPDALTAASMWRDSSSCHGARGPRHS